MERAGDSVPSGSIRGHQLSIVTQLLKIIGTMHHPGEMFQWLASVMVQCFDVSIIQFWMCEKDSSQPFVQLQAMAGQDPSLPAYVLMNEKVMMTVEYLSKGQRISPPQGVESVFPNYQASLLKRYGFSYCAYCLIERKVQFAPMEHELPPKRTGLAFIALLFLRRYPRHDLVPTISVILEQAIVIAERRGLLLPIADSTGRLLPPSGRQLTGSTSVFPQVAAGTGPLLAPQELLQTLPDLIPRQKQDARLLVSNNPFTGAVSLSDKQARRLYTAIDGHKTVTELCSSTGMTLKEIHTILQTLLTLHYIEIYTPNGQLVDGSLLFQNR